MIEGCYWLCAYRSSTSLQALKNFNEFYEKEHDDEYFNKNQKIQCLKKKKSHISDTSKENSFYFSKTEVDGISKVNSIIKKVKKNIFLKSKVKVKECLSKNDKISIICLKLIDK